MRVLAAGIARDALDLLDRHPDPATLGEMELEEIALLVAVATSIAPNHSGIARDAVIDVDDEFVGLQPLEQVLGNHAAQNARSTNPHGAEKLPIGDQHYAFRPARKTRVEAAFDQREAAGRRRVAEG